MKKYILVIGAVVITSVLLAGCASIPGQSWTWELEEGYNTLTFTQEQIDACVSDHPIDVFSSIELYADSVFEESTWLNYHFGHAGNTLLHIQPETTYRLKVTQDCTLTIG